MLVDSAQAVSSLGMWQVLVWGTGPYVKAFISFKGADKSRSYNRAPLVRVRGWSGTFRHEGQMGVFELTRTDPGPMLSTVA